jgi:maltooligosyltrehalose trehalohydrolase
MTTAAATYTSFISHEPQHLPQGALRLRDGTIEWRIWAPLAAEVQLVTWPNGVRTQQPMTAGDDGYHTYRAAQAEPGLRYAYHLGEGREWPDPAARWQPDGVHRPSALFFPTDFEWTDESWRGIPRADLVIYELHVGTFTPEGTFAAIIPRLAELKELGVTAIELMPVAQFPGDRNWGYDGVYAYAAQHSYGGPAGLQQLVNAAHAAGMAVLLDVVYNHFGPEGNYLSQYGPYFTDRYHTPWGEAVNYDGPDSDPVRQFVIDNACMWVRDFHMDGLRLDAVHAIYDFSARHILEELQTSVQQVAREQRRTVHVIAETCQNDVRMIDPVERHGFGLDGIWSDDFHHCVRTLLTGNTEGYYQDFGAPEHLAKAYEKVFVHDGCYSPFRRRNHGNAVEDRDRTKFVVCVHNHDQIGNRALGDRSASYLTPAAQRLACGLLMLSPCVPMLFMGEEYAEFNPFPFFCSFGDEELVAAVRRGRREEFAALKFKWGEEIPDPQDPATYEAAKLTWQWPAESLAAQVRKLYRDLLLARRMWPALLDRQHTRARVVDVAEATAEGRRRAILVVERGESQNACSAVVNLMEEPLSLLALAKPPGSPLLSTEEIGYGGERILAQPITELLPRELIIYGNREWRQ